MNCPSHGILFAIALAAAGFLSGNVTADETDDEAQTHGQAPAAGPSGQDGLRVYIDPETGEILDEIPPEARERIERRAREQYPLNYSHEGLESVTLPDGSVRLDLQGRFRSFQSVRRNDDGTLEHLCTQHPGVLHRFLHAHPETEATGDKQ